MGPAIETFLQALLILGLIVVPVALLLRKPLLRVWRNLKAADQRQMEQVAAQEWERKREEEARQRAIQEIQRDCSIENGPTEEQAERPVRRQ